MSTSKETCIVGSGYVGLITGLSLASRTETRVHFVEADRSRLDVLRSGRTDLFEEGLDSLFHDVSRSNLAAFHSSLDEIDFDRVRVSIICVGTPPLHDCSANLDDVWQVARDLKRVIGTRRHIVAVKSTVPPGTADRLRDEVFGTENNVEVATMPEFLREGCAVADALDPDRIVIGVNTDPAWTELAGLFAGFENSSLFRCKPTEAELIKYSNNSLLALLISFSNELSQISEAVGNSNVYRVIDGVLLDRRWRDVKGRLPGLATYFYPGCGFGGSCLPKDIAALVAVARANNVSVPILEGILETNANIKERFVQRIREILSAQTAHRKKLALLGLAFKPDTNDVRESPALAVIDAFLGDEIDICVHDPVAILPREYESAPTIRLTRDINAALTDADCCALVTAWRDYDIVDDELLANCMRQPTLVDGRAFFRDRTFKRTRYVALGVQR